MVRVEMSEPQLLSTDNSIAQISANVGFSNAKYYIDNFTGWFGCHPKEYRQLYKDELLGNKPWLVKEMPFDSINDAIEPYEEMPAFTGASELVKAVSLDFRKLDLFQKASVQCEDPKRFYKGYDPQQDCLDFLGEMLSDPRSNKLPPISTDTAKSKNGTFTFNDMKKPLYYLREFLEDQFDTIADHSDWYIMTKSGPDAQLLFFSKNPENTQSIEFNMFNIPGKYKITEHRLEASSSCIMLWQQLGFKPQLTIDEKEQIERMSAPRISWRMISSSGSFTYSVKLGPLDIVFAEIEKL